MGFCANMSIYLYIYVCVWGVFECVWGGWLIFVYSVCVYGSCKPQSRSLKVYGGTRLFFAPVQVLFWVAREFSALSAV